MADWTTSDRINTAKSHQIPVAGSFMMMMDDKAGSFPTRKQLFQNLTASVLSEVFLVASHSHPLPHAALGFYDEGSVEMDGTVFLEPDLNSEPCTFTRVCKHWRGVALSTPRLWSQIKIDLVTIPSSYENPELRFDLIFDWIRLSKSAPLKLCFNTKNHKDLNNLVERVVETAPRWEVLCLVTEYPTRTIHAPVSELHKNILAKAINLEYLGFARLPSYAGQFSVEKYPKLKYLQCPTRVSVVPHQGHNLESLHGSFDLSSAIAAISILQNLRDVKISVYSTKESPPNTKQLSSLAALSISGSPHSISGFLRRVDLPELRKIYVTVQSPRVRDNSDQSESTDSLEQLTTAYHKFLANRLLEVLDRAIDSLTEIHLNIPLQDQEILRTMPRPDNLQSLSLDVSQITTGGLRDLEWSSPNDGLNVFPHLTSISLRSKIPSDLSVESLTTIVRTRLEGTPATRIDIDIACDPKNVSLFGDNVDLAELRKHGLNLVLWPCKYSSYDSYTRGWYRE